MTLAEQIAIMKTLVENDSEATDEVCTSYLSVAEANVLNHMYPFADSTASAVPARYHFELVQLAARYFLRRGAQGETTHNENGTYRTYGNVDDSDILNKIPSYNAKFI